MCSTRLSIWNGSRLSTVGETHAPSVIARFVHRQLRALVLSQEFPCAAAHSVLRHNPYWFALYGTMGSKAATAELAADLTHIVSQRRGLPGALSTFVASFTGPGIGSESHFERVLWQQLQALHDEDALPWDEGVSSDPQDPRFSFSIAGRAFFVVGMHAASSRWARRFGWSTLVFNEHAQFDELRESGRFDRLRDTIRIRDTRLQGGMNPMCTDYGNLSEARQYSGRQVEDRWRCPLTVRGA
jgi:FPC/CPF motif-containing protein YcgG